MNNSNPFVSAPPPAASLAEALRGFGYAPSTAIADIIDNSISAQANRIRIDFQWQGDDSYITISDNGHGMDESELNAAMILGGEGPLAQRSSTDLGRFGLGLKTASFSQCRSLTVASKRASTETSLRRWDLDHITRPDINDWQLLLSPRKNSESRTSQLASMKHGTIVLWEGLDRILERLPQDNKKAQSAFLEIAGVVESHLSMVFQRFLAGRKPRLRIYMNGDEESRRIKPWDPFMSNHSATYSTPEETISTKAGSIVLQGFVLPHKDKIDPARYSEAAGPDGWTAQQGFYVYRNERLLLAGSWLGLGEGRAWTKEEAYRLARLRLDLPNTADHEWDIDVRKSTARPPRYLRPRLRDLAKKIRDEARRVFAHRGTYGHSAPIPDFRPLWLSKRKTDSVRYLIDRKHPAVSRALDMCSDQAPLLDLISLVESSVPVRRIWLDTAESGEVQAADAKPEQEELFRPILQELATHLVRGCGFTLEDAREQLKATDPFHQTPELVDDVLSSLAPDLER